MTDSSEFDELVAWAEGHQSSESVLQAQLQTASAVEAGSRLLAARINSKRMVSLMNGLAELDQAVMERVPMMDDVSLLAARRDMEKSMQATSDRIFNPTSQKNSGGSGGVHVNQVFPPSSATQLHGGEVQNGLPQSSRMRVRQLVAKVSSSPYANGKDSSQSESDE